MVRRPRAPDFCRMACSAAASRASSVNINSSSSMAKSAWYCFTNAFLGSVSTRTRSSLYSESRLTTTGQASDEFGYEAVLHEVVAVHVPADLVLGAFFQNFGSAAGVEADAPEILEGALFDYLVDALERASADEQNVIRAYLDEFLMGVLASALGRDVRHAALDYLQERLLHAFAGYVPGDRDIGTLARYLVYFVQCR